MRADRLLSILMFLQTRGRATTHRLAQEFEVSQRTILRDLYALRVAGFPVYTETGRNGGCHLHADYRLRLTDLTQDELSALFSMAVPLSLVDLGVGQQAKGALLKLAAALPAARRSVEQHARRRLHLDSQSWKSSNRALPAPTLTLLREAAWSDCWVQATFRRMRSIHIYRDIAPYGLVAKERRWYIVWAGRDGRIHADRDSTIVEATMIDDRFERPDSFDLATFWSQWTLRQDVTRRTYVVRALLDAAVVPVLVNELGQDHVRVCEEAWDGARTPYDLIFEHFHQARSTLLGLGRAAEVLYPEAMRRSLVDFAQQIERVYSDR